MLLRQAMLQHEKSMCASLIDPVSSRKVPLQQYLRHTGL